MNKSEKNDFLSILKYYKHYKILIISDLFFTIVEAVATLMIPLIVRHITQDIIYRVDSDVLKQIFMLGLVMLFLCIIILFAKWWTMYYGHLMGTYQERDMRDELYQHLQVLPISYYDNSKVGSLISRITTDLFEISELMHHGPENLLISLLKIIGSVIILSNINFSFSMITFAVVLLMAFLTYKYNKDMKKAYVWRREVLSDISSKSEDTLAGIRIVKSFTNTKKEINDFSKLNNIYVEAKKIAYKSLANLHSTTTFFSSFITIVIVVYGSFLIYKKEILIQDLLTFILYINLFLDPVKRLIDFSETFQSGFSGYQRFREIMNIKPDIVDREDAIELKNCKGNITFENVNFKYREKGDYVIDNINLNIDAGEYVAFCGFSGSGKTTLCSLIPRFYEVSSGSIKIDGTDIRNYSLESLRRNIGIVQQDTYLFYGNVIDNIRYGRINATDEECIEAAKEANAYDFIMSLPNGFKTDIGERGVKLSGGQKQRLSIARVFLKNPPILIFDEATSALDNESESIIKQSMLKLSKNRTMIVIAHRLSTIKNAKRIIVMDKFHIVEEGKHEELINKNGIYKKLYEAGY